MFASDKKEVLPSTGNLTITGYAPTVFTSDNKNVAPQTGSVTITGFRPTVFASDHKVVLPQTGSLAATGYAPTMNIGVSFLPQTGALTITGYRPTIEINEIYNAGTYYVPYVKGYEGMGHIEKGVEISDTLKNVVSLVGKLRRNG